VIKRRNLTWYWLDFYIFGDKKMKFINTVFFLNSSYTKVKHQGQCWMSNKNLKVMKEVYENYMLLVFD
jgi:hypothetical protein